MNKLSALIVCLIVVLSCENEVSEENSAESNAQSEIIHTTNQPKDLGIVSRLIADLTAQKFELENKDIHPIDSFYDWEKDIQFVIQGNGINVFYFKRTEAKPANYYPDFSLTVFQFKQEDEARRCLDKLALAAESGHKSRGRIPQKNPQTIVQNGKEVFFLSTRAEMFRGYIEDCANLIASY